MEVLSNYLIKDYDDYYTNNSIYKEKNKLNINDNLNKSINDYLITDIIEYIEDNNYSIENKEQKYKIFDDITSIIKNKNNKIELIINIPKSNDVVKINKIKIPKSIENYLTNIFISLDDNIILSDNDIFNKNIKLLNTNYNNSINCTKGTINLHIIFEPNSINKIINSNIYIYFTYINLKNKIKFL
jgi:hypothetical protein